MTIQFFWNNKFISKHETKEEAFNREYDEDLNVVENAFDWDDTT